MTDPVVDPAPNPDPKPDPAAKPSLEDSLAGLDEQTRAFVLGEVQSARNEAKNLRDRVKEAEPIVSQWKALEEASKTEVERERENSARKDGRIGTLQTRLVSSQIKALAASDFADPSDALAALSDSSKYLGLEDEINEDAIKADLDAVLERKPHWRKQPNGPAAPRIPAPNPAQGSGASGRSANDPAEQFAALIRQQLNR